MILIEIIVYKEPHMHRNDLPKILFEKIDDIVKPYPEYVEPVTQMIDNTVFFPGGKGLWLEIESDVLPSILVLGQDFSTVEEYQKMLNGNSSDLDCPTWKNLIKLFESLNIDLCRCFFSNVFMGLRKTKSMVGRFPGLKDKKFVERNLEFLSLQIETIKPELIITLGLYATKMVADLSPQDLINWKEAKSFKKIDDAVKYGVRFGNHKCNCVALVHPSMRPINVKNRKYKNYVGNDAEVCMLRDALANNYF